MTGTGFAALDPPSLCPDHVLLMCYCKFVFSYIQQWMANGRTTGGGHAPMSPPPWLRHCPGSQAF